MTCGAICGFDQRVCERELGHEGMHEQTGDRGVIFYWCEHGVLGSRTPLSTLSSEQPGESDG